jgi:hypothetical protein
LRAEEAFRRVGDTNVRGAQLRNFSRRATFAGTRYAATVCDEWAAPQKNSTTCATMLRRGNRDQWSRLWKLMRARGAYHRMNAALVDQFEGAE